MARVSLDDSALYINRHTSWLQFNRRILEEAEDRRNPLLERVRFLAIASDALDEFFEVQVGALLQRIEDGSVDSAADGLIPTEERDLIAKETHALVSDHYRCWNEQLVPELAANGIRVLSLADLDDAAKEFVRDYTRREVDPLLTPVAIDPAHPFPRVLNKALCLGLLLRRKRHRSAPYVGVVLVPRTLPRLLRVPGPTDSTDFVFLVDLIAAYAPQIYPGYEILARASFRVTRNSNLYLQEEEARSLLESVRAELHNRRRGDVVRLETDADADPSVGERLRSTFELEPWQVYRNRGPVNLPRVQTLYQQLDRPDLKFKGFSPRELRLSKKSRDIFEELREHEILLHHPFDSYEPVVNFIHAAAEDPHVLSIKQTLYRTSEDSPFMRALMEAATSKEVTVVVELKARFDEASNIRWARTLEDAGVQVFHGVVGLKTHCKLTLVTRRDPDRAVRQYAHLGTGNYNPDTARSYTDLSLLTTDPLMTAAVHSVFGFLTAYAERPDYEPLLVAPVDLAAKFLSFIARETAHARQGRPAHIIAKMNGLLDKSIIRALYEASQAGVRIDLIVRGMCALRPGVRGVSENIRVRSIVGRLLEHSRVFYFANGGETEVYLGSADWMPRNLYERVEVVFPLRDRSLCERARDEILEPYLLDNVKARVLAPNGGWKRATPGAAKARSRGGNHAHSQFNAQDYLMALAEGKAAAGAIPARTASLRNAETVRA